MGHRDRTRATGNFCRQSNAETKSRFSRLEAAPTIDGAQGQCLGDWKFLPSIERRDDVPTFAAGSRSYNRLGTGTGSGRLEVSAVNRAQRLSPDFRGWKPLPQLIGQLEAAPTIDRVAPGPRILAAGNRPHSRGSGILPRSASRANVSWRLHCAQGANVAVQFQSRNIVRLNCVASARSAQSPVQPTSRSPAPGIASTMVRALAG